MFEAVVLDGAAKLEELTVQALSASDVVLIPVTPSALDLWGVRGLVELVKRRQEVAGLDARFVVSRQIVGSALASDVQGALESFGLPVLDARLSQRVAFTEALGLGSTVFDTEPNGKAAQEARELVAEVRAAIADR